MKHDFFILKVFVFHASLLKQKNNFYKINKTGSSNFYFNIYYGIIYIIDDKLGCSVEVKNCPPIKT